MPLRKIADPPNERCFHPEHNPPTQIVLPPGTYEHECPSCHQKQRFTVRRLICASRDEALSEHWRGNEGKSRWYEVVDCRGDDGGRVTLPTWRRRDA